MTISDSSLISARYMNGWFVTDVVAVVPLEIISFALGNSILKVTPFRVLRLLRAVHVFKYSDAVEDFFSLRKHLSSAARRILWLFIFLLFVINLVACIWIHVSESLRDAGVVQDYWLKCRFGGRKGVMRPSQTDQTYPLLP